MTMTRSEGSGGHLLVPTGSGFAGGVLLGYGIRRKGMLGAACAVTGAACLAYAVARIRSFGGRSCGHAEAVVECDVSDAYRFCRQLNNLRSIVPKEIMSPGLAQEPGSSSRVLESRENDLIVWRSTRDRFQYLGRMEFEPAHYGQGTSISFSLYRYPVGFFASADLQREAEESLRRLKAVLEAPAAAGVFDVQEESVDTAEATGWAPESGEPEERRFGYSRGDVYSRASQEVGFAPESGDRVLDRGDVDESLPEPERLEEKAGENRVLEGSEESFPASDAPSWAPGHT